MKKVSQPVLCINNGIVYKSLTAAANTFNICKGEISRNLTGARGSVHGLVFVKVNGTETKSELEKIIAEGIKKSFLLEIEISVSLPERSDNNG